MGAQASSTRKEDTQNRQLSLSSFESFTRIWFRPPGAALERSLHETLANVRPCRSCRFCVPPQRIWRPLDGLPRRLDARIVGNHPLVEAA